MIYFPKKGSFDGVILEKLEKAQCVDLFWRRPSAAILPWAGSPTSPDCANGLLVTLRSGKQAAGANGAFVMGSFNMFPNTVFLSDLTLSVVSVFPLSFGNVLTVTFARGKRVLKRHSFSALNYKIFLLVTQRDDMWEI